MSAPDFARLAEYIRDLSRAADVDVVIVQANDWRTLDLAQAVLQKKARRGMPYRVLPRFTNETPLRTILLLPMGSAAPEWDKLANIAEDVMKAVLGPEKSGYDRGFPADQAWHVRRLVNWLADRTAVSFRKGILGEELNKIDKDAGKARGAMFKGLLWQVATEIEEFELERKKTDARPNPPSSDQTAESDASAPERTPAPSIPPEAASESAPMRSPQATKKLRSAGKALQADLVEFLAERGSATYHDVAENVHKDDLTTDEAIRQLVRKTNVSLDVMQALGRLHCAAGCVHWTEAGS